MNKWLNKKKHTNTYNLVMRNTYRMNQQLNHVIQQFSYHSLLQQTNLNNWTQRTDGFGNDKFFTVT